MHNLIMSVNMNKTHSVASPGESYYFYLVPRNISYIGTEQLFLTRDAFFKFSLFKGKQKFSDCKDKIPAFFNEANTVQIEGTHQLAFLIPNYAPAKKFIFYLKLYFHDKGMSQNVGQLTIDGNRLIKAFNEDKSYYIPETSELSNNYQLQYEIFIGKSKNDLDRIITDTKNLAKIETISQSRSQPEKQIPSSPLPIRKKSKFSIISQKDAQLEQSKEYKINKDSIIQNQKYQDSPHKSSPQKTSFLKLEKVQNKCIRQESQFYDFDLQITKKKSRHRKQSKSIRQKDQLYEQSIKLPDSTVRKSLVKNSRQQMGTSRSMKEVLAQQQRKKVKNQNKSNQNSFKNSLKFIIFGIISLFLIYNAMSPSKKYHSRKRI